MSLHKFAEQVAANGRGEDSLLVHMTPDEVQRLQAFAEANGRSLTINPETGLPEAGFLSDLFKAVAPIALGAFLGPAGLGMSSMMAGVATGGITTLATGSLSRGLMAGLGAYGGAGLGESFMTAGGGMSAANAATTAQQQLSGANLALGEAMPAQAAEQFTKDAVARMTPSGAVSAGVSKAIADPMAFAKGNLGNLAYAAAPIMAGAMVPTTTKMPEPKNTGYIRQFDYNINPETGRPDPLYGMRAMTPVKASEFGDKTFQGQRDLFRQQNPNPYELGVGSLNQPPQPQQQPTPMAKGGIVALAGGGVPGYANGMLVGDQDVFNYFKGLDQAKLASGALDAQIAADMQKYNVGAADIGRITGTQANQGNFEQRFVQAINPATLSSADFLAKTADVGLTDQALANAMRNAGMSTAAQYAATHTLNDAAGITGAPTSAQNLYNSIGYKAGDLKGDAGGIAGMYANISGVAGSLQDKINSGALTVAQAQNLSLAEMDRLGINQADIKGATGKDFGNLFTAKKPDTPVCGFGTKLNAAGTACEPIICGAGFQLNKAGTACEAITKVDDKKIDDKVVDDGKTCGPGFTKSIDGKSCVPIGTVVTDETTCPTGQHRDATTGKCVPNISATQNTTTTVDTPTSLITAPATSLPVGVSGTTGPSIFGGGATVNPNGTITTSPVIPGIPAGGFTGMTSLRDAYTTGGGSLGYAPKAPKTMAEFEQMYNKQTGDSLAAYNYLMGKGGGKYPTKSTASQIAVPYGEYVLGKKPAAAAKPVVKTTTEIKGTPGQPQTYFNEAEYLAANPDVAAELKTGKSTSGQPTKFKSGYEHYLMYGKAGGRAFTGDYAGYTTALALATAANSGGGPGNTTSATTGNTVSDSNTANSITGLAAPADNSIAVADAVASPASSATPSGGSTSVGDGTAPGATGDGDSAGDDAVGGYYSRGKLNYRSKDMAMGGATGYAMGGGLGSLGSYSDGGRLLRGPGDGVSDSIPATIGRKQQPARLADGEFVIPARIVSELGNGSTDAGAKKLYAMMDRVQRARSKTTGKNKVAANSRADKYLPA
jgi:hypothetical protein